MLSFSGGYGIVRSKVSLYRKNGGSNMGLIKGCTNIECGEKHKKVKYKEDDLFCPKCGKELSYVCAKCYTPLENAGKRCEKCQQKIDDRKAKAKDVVHTATNAAKKIAPMAALLPDAHPAIKVIKPIAKVVDKLPRGKK